MIKVEIEELKRLQLAIEDFQPYSEEFIKSTIGSLEGFNSDFITEIKKTLVNMTDTKAPDLLKKVQKFHYGALSVVEEFEKKDIGISEQLKLNK